MRHRTSVATVVVLALIGAAWLTAEPVMAGQGAGGKGVAAPASAPARAGAPAKPYTPPKTPDGQPDIQGYWTNSTYTPLERPNGVTKELYTPQEAEAAEKRAAERE